MKNLSCIQEYDIFQQFYIIMYLLNNVNFQNICDIPIVRFFCFVLGRLKVDIGIEMSDKMTVQDGSKAHSFSTGNFWIDVKIRLVILKVGKYWILVFCFLDSIYKLFLTSILLVIKKFKLSHQYNDVYMLQNIIFTYLFSYNRMMIFWNNNPFLFTEVKVDGDIHVYQLFDTSYIPKNLFQVNTYKINF